MQFKYPHYTPYQYAGNKPVSYIDLDGLEEAKTDSPDQKVQTYFINSDTGQFLGQRDGFKESICLIDLDGLTPGNPRDAGDYQASINSRYIGFGLRNPVATSRIGFGVTPGATDISTNATRFATRGEILYGSKKGQEDRGSENGAFRHSLWQATITSEFGGSVAAQAGNAHEENPFVDLSVRVFSKLDEADQTVDLLNNVIGRRIGTTNQGANMKELANLVLDEFKNNGLYTVKKGKDGDWIVSKTILSFEKYTQLKEVLKV